MTFQKHCRPYKRDGQRWYFNQSNSGTKSLFVLRSSNYCSFVVVEAVDEISACGVIL